jgi:hypothetical protein
LWPGSPLGCPGPDHVPVNRTSRIIGGGFACNLSWGQDCEKGLIVSTAFYIRRPRGNKNDLYVLGKISEDGSSVLCVTSASGIKTIPLFSNRVAARRFLRATPLRFGLLGCGWRTMRILGSELDSLFLLGLPAGIRQIALDLCPEELVGECSAEPLSEVP